MTRLSRSRRQSGRVPAGSGAGRRAQTPRCVADAADLALSARRDRSVHETGMHDIQWNRNTQSDGRPTATLRMEAKVTGLPVLAHLG